MSAWYSPSKKDIEISSDGKNLDVYLGQDDFGSIYAEISIADLTAVLANRGSECP